MSCGLICHYCQKRIYWWQSSIRPSDLYHTECLTEVNKLPLKKRGPKIEKSKDVVK